MDELRIILANWQPKPDLIVRWPDCRYLGFRVERGRWDEDRIDITLAFRLPGEEVVLCGCHTSEAAIRADFFGTLTRIHEFLDGTRLDTHSRSGGPAGMC